MAALVLLLLFSTGVSAQEGFLNILCGANSSKESDNGLFWIPDTNYTNGGTSIRIENKDIYTTIRRFENPVRKSCYKLPIIPDEKYLVRLRFDTDKFQAPSSFSYSIESQDMLSMNQASTESPPVDEQILTTSGKVLYVCLIRENDGSDPFVSAIQLIRLRPTMYLQVNRGKMLKLGYRTYVYRSNNNTIRYPHDKFDRLWKSGNFTGKDPVSYNVTSIAVDETNNLPPSQAMETSIIIESIWKHKLPALLPDRPALFFCYFAQFGNNRTLFRFTVSMEEENFAVSLDKKYTAQEVALMPRTKLEAYKLTLSAAAPDGKATLNSYEAYNIMQTDPFTNPTDVDVLQEFKQKFGLQFGSWISDPCYGVAWDHIKCSETRVSGMNLSGSNLNGQIPPTLGHSTYLEYLDLSNNSLTGTIPDLSNLTQLTKLNLQNNKLNGSLPDWLSMLRYLRELSIQNNNLSGEIPSELLQRVERDGLQFNYGGNPMLRIPKEARKMKKIIIIFVTVGAALACIGLFILLAFMTAKMKGRHHGTLLAKNKDNLLIEIAELSNFRVFTAAEILKATGNLCSIIGNGGFGTVYLGIMENGSKIAVKVLSAYSDQGKEQFLNELHLLSVVNYKHLVSLLGYCIETHELTLVYEYLQDGSLEDCLYGSDSQRKELTWKNRVQIALDAAFGLQYLHESCTPKIIHRDVKPANILLGNGLRAKLSDFGISKWTKDDQATHITTAIKGTPGYMDPEYFKTFMLTEKSDIYSLGVVLLEMICARRPVDRTLPLDQIFLARWVKPSLESDDSAMLLSVVDKNLVGKFCSIESLHRVAKLAMECVAENPSERPDMSKVIAELSQALQEEQERNRLSVRPDEIFLSSEPDEICLSCDDFPVP